MPLISCEAAMASRVEWGWHPRWSPAATHSPSPQSRYGDGEALYLLVTLSYGSCLYGTSLVFVFYVLWACFRFRAFFTTVIFLTNSAAMPAGTSAWWANKKIKQLVSDSGETSHVRSPLWAAECPVASGLKQASDVSLSDWLPSHG